MLTDLLEELSKYIPVSEKLGTRLSEEFVKKEISKNTCLLDEGTICDKIYFLQRGLARGFLYYNQTDITTWFARENEFVFGTNSFFYQTKSIESIETLEDCEVLMLSYAKAVQLFDEFSELETLRQIFFEHYYLSLKKRMFTLQSMKSAERYQELLHNDPELVLRAPLGHLSSYLGIAQETLSRIRKQK